MPPVPDLVRLSKLDAHFSSDPQYTQHTYYISSAGQRRVRQEERWKRQKELGAGSFGAVYLERCVQGEKVGKVRAVKKIKKPEDTNYYRELEALAHFSYPKVSTISCSVCRYILMVQLLRSLSAAL
jgi:calcium/calmodulin-dependent protein kinase I